MSLTTAGLGLATSRGAGRRITTDAGSGTAIRGPGGRDRLMAGTVRSGRRLTSHSGDGAADLDLDSASAAGAASAGFRLVPATGSIRGGVDTAVASAGLAEALPVVDLEASRRCMAERASPTSRTCMMPTLEALCRRSMPDTSAPAGSRRWQPRVSRSVGLA